MNILKLSFSPDDDGTGELHALVQADGFAGSGSAWFKVEELEAFCASIGNYPLEQHAHPFIAGGFWSDDGALDRTNLALRISPHNSRGTLRVIVELAEPPAGNEPGELLRRVITWFTVGYNDLSRFQTAFGRLLSGAAEEAVLTSTMT